MNLVRRGLTIQDLQKHTPSGSVIARADTTAVGPKKTCERSRSRSGSGSGSRLRSTASGGPSERREGNVVNTEKEMEQEKGDRAKVDKDASHLEADYNKRSRTLTMIVLGSYGIALDDKSLSYAQLAHGLLAGLIGHASLFFHARILHRDVSLWNIIYSHTPIPIPTSRRIFCGNRDILHGFLIDLDFAIPWVSLRPGTKYKRVGTVPFMAVEVLEASIRHSYRHDLESFFYVTLYCSAGTREKRAKIHSLWSQPPLMEVVGEKRRLITAHGALEKFMVEIGTSAPWRQALVAIRSTLWGLWGPDCGVVYATSFDWSRVRVPGDFVKPGMGNFVAYERIREVLAWLVDQEVERERQEQLGVAM